MFKAKHPIADFFEGMLIGTSLGAITTFLLGTEKGKKLQKEWGHKLKIMKHKAAHYSDDIMNSPTVQKFKRKAKKVIKGAMVTKRVAKKSVRKAKSKIHKKRKMR